MNRIWLLFLSLWSVHAVAQDASYYRVHPIELQSVIKQCPDHPPVNITCSELQMIAQQLNTLAYELQTVPQQFGQKILALQESIEKEKIQLQEKPSQSELIAFLEQEKAQLNERLAVVKWLESPN